MTEQQTWRYPDWIYSAKSKLTHIDLSKFPSRIWIDHEIIHPDKNKFVKDWAICINVKLEIRDRKDGYKTSLVNPEGIYIYGIKNFEQIVYVEIERLLCHELKECFQIREDYNKPVIIFDPHNYKRPRIKMSAYDKVDLYRHHPSFLKWFTDALIKRIDELRTARTTKLVNYNKRICAWFAKVMFEPKKLSQHE